MRVLDTDKHIATLGNGACVFKGPDMVLIEYLGLTLVASYDRSKDWQPNLTEPIRFDIETANCNHRIFAWVVADEADPMPFDIHDQVAAMQVLDALTAPT